MKVTTSLLGVSLIVAISNATYAGPVSTTATDNATVQVAGPRSGSNGKAFFNMEGSANGAFGSFGVADFTLPSFAGTATGISSATLSLTQSNAAFSHNGPLSVYLTQQTGVNIQPVTSPLHFTGSDGASSIDPALSPVSLLGTGAYTVVSNGTVDSYTLSFTGANLTYLLNELNIGGPLRLVVTPDASDVAATYAGFTNSTFSGPTLSLNVQVPEPHSAILLGLGAVGILLLGARRRRR